MSLLCLHESDEGFCRLKEIQCGNKENCDLFIEIPENEHLSDEEFETAWKEKKSD